MPVFALPRRPFAKEFANWLRALHSSGGTQYRVRQGYCRAVGASRRPTLSTIARLLLSTVHLTECQLDELWTFVYKKEKHLTAFEKLVGRYGDAWIWIAFDPIHKLVPTWRVGKRTLHDAKKFIKALKSKHDSHLPFFTSDELPHYADALLEIYGETYTPQRKGRRGRFPLPRKRPPSDLCYAVVIKERDGGRMVSVTTQLIYGTENNSTPAWALHPSAP